MELDGTNFNLRFSFLGENVVMHDPVVAPFWFECKRRGSSEKEFLKLMKTCCKVNIAITIVFTFTRLESGAVWIKLFFHLDDNEAL